MKKYNVLDLFAGCGGLSYGFKKNPNFDIKLAIDIWEPAKLTYNYNNPDIPFLLDDIKNINEEIIQKYFKSGVDIIIGGPPCQGFSMCGTRNIDDKRNDLFYEYARIVNLVKPYIFVMENVKGILSMKNKEGNSVIKAIVSEFSNLGYNIQFKVLNSKYYGVPQARERVIFIGTRKDIPNNFEYPKFCQKDKFYTVKDALIGIPNRNSLNGEYNYNYENNEYINMIRENIGIYNHDIPIHKSDVVRRMSLVPQGGNWKDIPEEYRAGGTHSNAYRRLDQSKPSVTIKHAYKSMIIHPTENRCLSIREVARLQSFSDNYIFKGTKTSQYQQLANAVPPNLSIMLANSIEHYIKKNNIDINYTFIDLFSGLGGFRVAFENLKCKCLFSSEIDSYAKETYKNNFGDYPQGDITKILSEEIPDHDILCAGFPCQPFSIGGLRLGFEDSRGTLFFEVARILKDKQPKAFILENVRGIDSHDKGNTLKVIKNTLREVGYEISYKHMNALDYGIPQNRDRWYCIGFRKNLNITFDINSKDGIIYEFPRKTELEFTLEDIVNPNVEGYNSTETAMRNIKKHYDKYIQNKKIDNTKLIIANDIRPSRCSFKNNGTIPCLTAKMGTGGNNVPVIVNYGRKLTEKECLLLMGFPEGYKITPKTQQSYKQIGNSVVVPIIQQLASNIIKVLNQVNK